MDNKNNSGADPNAAPATPSFDDAVGKEQPVNSVPSGTPSGDQPDKKPDATAKPEDQSGVKPNDKSESPEGKQPEGDKSFWGKFKSEDDAKHSYDEAQTKIIEQGKELNELKTASEKNDQFLSILDKALVKQPQLAEQLKAALADAMKASDAEPKDEPDIEAILDKKLEERETKAKTKAEIDKWISEHEDFKEPELGHQVLDIIEKEKLPFNARTLQLAYDSITKDSQAKKAADEALKKEEVKNLERENASGVGGGSPATKGNTPQDSPFDDLVGSSINPNKVR
ncbi:MAG: hypothetical protein WC693_06605 [Patescibacteria group bacterium]|jgi:hypothetical protein